MNIETLLTLAAVPKPWQTTYDSTRDALAAESIRELIAEVIFRAFPQENLPGNKWTIKLPDDNQIALTQLAKFLLNTRSAHVITFNYDPLLENALEQYDVLQHSKEHEQSPQEALHRKPRFSINYSYGFQGLVRDQTSHEIVRAEGFFPRDAMLFLKLHGSITWISRVLGQLPAFPEDVLCFSCHEGNRKLDYYDPMFERKHFIVPPLLDKGTLLRNPVIDVIWGQAAKLLTTACELTFIGYSLPPTDYYSEYLLRTVPCRPSKVTVVDYIRPDCTGAEREQAQRAVMRRFRSIYPFMDDGDFCFDGAAEWCIKLQCPWAL